MLLTERKRSIFFVEAAYRADHLFTVKATRMLVTKTNIETKNI